VSQSQSCRLPNQQQPMAGDIPSSGLLRYTPFLYVSNCPSRKSVLKTTLGLLPSILPTSIILQPCRDVTSRDLVVKISGSH